MASVSVSPPSIDGTTNNYGGVTGLTVTRNTSSSSGRANYGVVSGTETQGSSSQTSILYQTQGGNFDGTLTVTSGSGYVTTFTSSSQIGISQPGPWTVVRNGEDNASIFIDYTQILPPTYSFTNNTGYSVTIEGTPITNGSTSVVTLNGAQFYIFYTEPSSEDSSEEETQETEGQENQITNTSVLPPLVNGTTNDYGGITGLSLVRTGTTFSEQTYKDNQIAAGTYSNVVPGLPGDGIDVTITSTAITNIVQTATNWSVAFNLAANTGPQIIGYPSMISSGSDIGLSGTGNTSGTGVYGCIYACLLQMGATNVSVGSNAFTTFTTAAAYTSNPGTTLAFTVPILIQNFGPDIYGSTATVQYVSATNSTTTITSSTAVATNKTGETITINGVPYIDNTEIGIIGSNSNGITTTWIIPAVTTLTSYTFTNNTGNSVTIEGVKIPNGNSATITLDGTQFNITYTGTKVQSDAVPDYVIGTKPNYAALLSQIAVETNAARKQAWIEACYQFPAPLTETEQDLFNYINKDYIDDNPGLDDEGNFVSLVGVYFDELGRKTSDVVGGPYFIYGTGKTGFGIGQTGYFYPLYTNESAITGTYHVHTFNEYNKTFYMPDSEMNHAVQTQPTQYARYLSGISAIDNAPITTTTTTTTTEQQTATTTITVPDTDGTVNNYGGVTGLTIVRSTSTSSNSSTVSLEWVDNPLGYADGNSDRRNGGWIPRIPSGTSLQANDGTVYVAGTYVSINIGLSPYMTQTHVTEILGSNGSKLSISGTAPHGVGAFYNSTANSSGVFYDVGIPGSTTGYTTSLKYYSSGAVIFRDHVSVTAGNGSGVVSSGTTTATIVTSTIDYTFTNNTGNNIVVEGSTVFNGTSSSIDISGDVTITYVVGS